MAHLVGCQEDVCQIAFSVSDTGIGIKPEYLDTLFDAFTQTDTTTTREYGGTGLGLSISKDLVAMMGGNLQVESQVKQGSTFTFDLNLKRISDIDVSHLTVPSDLMACRVLVVDDNDLARQLLS